MPGLMTKAAAHVRPDGQAAVGRRLDQGGVGGGGRPRVAQLAERGVGQQSDEGGAVPVEPDRKRILGPGEGVREGKDARAAPAPA